MPCCQPAPSDDAADQSAVPASPDEVREALAAAAELGLFFELADPAGDADDEAGWQPAGLLYERDGEALDSLLDVVMARLAGCERRVAASLFFQGYAARLLSPQVGCLVCAGCVPAVPADLVTWRRPDAEIVQLGLAAGPGWRGSADRLIGLAVAQSFDEHLRPLAAALRARAGLPASVLRDNAASALVGALRLADSRIQPGWRHLATRALNHPRLRGSGTLSQNEPAFVRRSCCLYYRVDDGGTCGDCPLTASPTASRRQERR
jgi:iron complex transport system ATP-binding protein